MYETAMCQYGEVKHGKLYHCTNKAVGEITIEGEQVLLCPLHLTNAKRIQKRLEEYEKLSEELKAKQRQVLETTKRLESLASDKLGQSITCRRCKEVYSHTGRLEFQRCSKCGALEVI